MKDVAEMGVQAADMRRIGLRWIQEAVTAKGCEELLPLLQ